MWRGAKTMTAMLTKTKKPLLLLTTEDKNRPTFKMSLYCAYLKQTRASTFRGITGGRGSAWLLCWHLFLSKSTASKGHTLIMLFTAVKIHIVEMSWHYHSGISSGAVILTHWTSFNVKHRFGYRTNNRITAWQIYYQLWWMKRGREQNALLVS